jgi:hypothetical protein
MSDLSSFFCGSDRPLTPLIIQSTGHDKDSMAFTNSILAGLIAYSSAET